MSMKKAAAFMGMSAALGGGFKLPRVRMTRPTKVHHTPPRSMTEEEKVYYDKHKNLNGFYRTTKSN